MAVTDLDKLLGSREDYGPFQSIAPGRSRLRSGPSPALAAV